MKKLIIILIVVVIVFLFLKSTCKEFFGQDASLRVGAGSVAGTGMYGYDPIQQFQDQIDESKYVHPKYSSDPVVKEGMCTSCMI